jgi:hypothetical protein
MKKLFTLVLLGLVFLLFSTSMAFSWGSATHAYIAGHIGKFLPLMNANEMYGIMAPDIFNYVFTLDPGQMAAIQYYTHGRPGEEGFMEVWRKASWWGYQKSLAYGYVAHNDVWGIDSTAHHSGVKIGQGVGYVILKAYKLLEQNIVIPNLTPPEGLQLWMIFQGIGLTSGTDQLELAHNLFETAGDIYLAQQDRLIGEKIIGAALARSNDFPALLTKAMGISWKDMIYAAEKEFRRSMVLYGGALIQDQDTAIKNMADQMAQLGMLYLQAKGVQGITLDLAKILAEKVLRAALPLCGDYMKEVNATIGFVKSNLMAHSVWY